MTRSIRLATAMFVGAVNFLPTACAYSVQPFESVPGAVQANPSMIYVVTRDGTRRTLTQPVVKDDSLAGFSVEQGARHYRHIALSDIDTVKAQKLVGNGTAIGIGAVTVGVGVAVIFLATHYCSFSCKPH